MSRLSMKKSWGWGAATAALFLGSVLPAKAEVRPELGIFFGALFADEELTGSQQDANDVNPLVGLRGGLRLQDHFGLFADIVHAPIDAAIRVDDVNANLFRGGLELFGGPHWRNGETFLALGGGLGRFSIEDQDALSKPFASLGLGQVYKVSDHGRFRWEVRGERVLVGEDEADFDDDFNQFEMLIGGAYAFGGTGPSDSDGDGVMDDKDKCPKTPRGWAVDADGCPLDTDGDGVPDGADKCPGTPKGATVDKKGCPSDSDMDGVWDGIDQCPDTPRGAKVDSKGCPLDSDGDGVYDGLDKCPDTPKGAKVDADGCPEVAPLFTPEKKQLILEGVNFETNSDRLTPDSRGILDKVAASLKAYQDVRVEVGGHTDARNSDEYNLGLSARRAASVKQYLVGKGVNASQLETKGYGESTPIATNDTEEGMAKNRRVELKKID